MSETEQTTETVHQAPPRRSALAEGSMLSAGVLLVLALWAMVNYLGWRHYERFDWTSSQLYTLSEKSERVLAQIDRDIDIVTVIRADSPVYTQVDELVERYVAANPERIERRDLDTARDRLELEQMIQTYNIERENVIVIATDDDRRVVDEFDLVEYDMAGPMGQPSVREFKGEQQITSAILSLIESEKPTIRFTSGHGEVPTAPSRGASLSRAASLLGGDNFDLQEWRSLGEADVPADTDLLVIAGPESGFLPPELDAFSRYLDGGGRMLVFADVVFEPGGEQQIADLGLGEWLASYGVELHDDIVIDPASALPLFGAETIFTAEYGNHPIVETLAESGTPVLLGLTRSMAQGDVPGDAQVVDLVRTSSEAWGETDFASLDRVEAGEGDFTGPLTLAMAVSFPGRVDDPLDEPPADPVDDAADASAGETAEEATEETAGETTDEPLEPSEDREARLVVFGDVDLATDGSVGNGGNALLLLNTFNWLVEREELIEIEGREPKQSRLSMTQGEFYSLLGIVLGLLPLLAVVAGVWVWLRRRR
ncbi:MAG: GldG family protein [Acidobacteriota bacterium]